jgi:hypothetical protein
MATSRAVGYELEKLRKADRAMCTRRAVPSFAGLPKHLKQGPAGAYQTSESWHGQAPFRDSPVPDQVNEG